MTDQQRRHRVFRSCLYVPGHRPDAIARAYDSAADAVLLDLEDSVPQQRKALAREIVAQVLNERVPKPTYVRVNPMSSGRGEDDVIAVAGPALAGIRLAKVGAPEEVQRVAELLRDLGHSAAIHVLVESARALEHAYDLATASTAVTMLGLGESDLQADLWTAAEGPMMDASRARVITAARAAGLPSPCQSAYPEPRDLDGLRDTTEHGRRLGFLGRMALHPAQIPIIHDVHTPTTEEIDDAREVCAAADLANAEGRSVIVTAQGRIVAPPVVALAKQALELADALELTPHPVGRRETSEPVRNTGRNGDSS